MEMKLPIGDRLTITAELKENGGNIFLPQLYFLLEQEGKGNKFIMMYTYINLSVAYFSRIINTMPTYRTYLD